MLRVPTVLMPSVVIVRLALARLKVKLAVSPTALGRPTLQLPAVAQLLLAAVLPS